MLATKWNDRGIGLVTTRSTGRTRPVIYSSIARRSVESDRLCAEDSCQVGETASELLTVERVAPSVTK